MSSGFRDSRIYGKGLYGADPEIFSPGPPLGTRPKQFIFVGEFNPNKAPDLLLRAFERFRSENPDWRILMIGRGELQASLHGTSVEILPFQAPDIIAEKLRQSRFLVLPSHEEHWGVVVHEDLLLSGCGLILSDAIGSGPDLLSDKNGYAFPAGDESALYRRLCEAANSPATRLERISGESVRLGHRFGPEHFRRSFDMIVEKAWLEQNVYS